MKTGALRFSTVFEASRNFYAGCCLQDSGNLRNFATSYELELYFEMGHHLHGGHRSLHADSIVLDVSGHHDPADCRVVVH